MAAASTQSNNSSDEEGGIFNKFIQKAFNDRTRLDYGKQSVTVVTSAAPNGAKKRAKTDQDEDVEDKENRLPVTKRRPSTNEPPAEDTDPQSESEKKDPSPPVKDTRTSSITIVKRSQVDSTKTEYVKSWVRDLSPIDQEADKEDNNEPSSQESEIIKPKKTKSKAAKPKQSKAPAKRKATKSSKKKTAKQADYATVSMPSNYFFDGADEVARPEFNIFEEVETSPVTSTRSKKPAKSILKSSKSETAQASKPEKGHASKSEKGNVSKREKDRGSEPEKGHASEPEEDHASKSEKGDVSKQEKDHSSEPEKDHASKQKKGHASKPESINSSQESQSWSPVKSKLAKSGRVLRDRTNVSYVIEPVTVAAKRMEEEAKKTPPKNRSPASKTNHRRAKRTRRTEEDEELDKEMEQFAKEYEGIKNYKLIVESDSK